MSWTFGDPRSYNPIHLGKALQTVEALMHQAPRPPAEDGLLNQQRDINRRLVERIADLLAANRDLHKIIRLQGELIRALKGEKTA